MARDFAMEFYNSPRWEKCRNAYMRIPVKTVRGVCSPGLCERCFANGEIRPAEIVHHVKHVEPWNINDPHVTLDYKNLMRVCRKCHGELHGRGNPESRVYFDEEGNTKIKER